MQTRAVLFFSANPSSTQHLDILAEYAGVRRALFRHLSWWDELEIVPEWSLDDDVRMELQGRRPQCLHFAGHGERDGGMVLQPPGAQAVSTDVAATADYLRLLAAPCVPLVVLNLCHSALLAERLVTPRRAPPPLARAEPANPPEALVEVAFMRDVQPLAARGEAPPAGAVASDAPESINVAIGMEGAIADAAAIAFARSLYQALASGSSVAGAFAIAAARTKAEYRGAANPKLYHRAEVDPERLFVTPVRRAVGPAYTSVAWGTLLAMCFYVAVLVFYQFYSPPPPLKARPGNNEIAAMAFTFWLFIAPVFVLMGFYRSGRVPRLGPQQ